ncbi:MAG: hypothetical protein ACJAWV_002007 [Flammeovirgaceae bacterium]|jgi:hypothetical protein
MAITMLSKLLHIQIGWNVEKMNHFADETRSINLE